VSAVVRELRASLLCMVVFLRLCVRYVDQPSRWPTLFYRCLRHSHGHVHSLTHSLIHSLSRSRRSPHCDLRHGCANMKRRSSISPRDSQNQRTPQGVRVYRFVDTYTDGPTVAPCFSHTHIFARPRTHAHTHTHIHTHQTKPFPTSLASMIRTFLRRSLLNHLEKRREAIMSTHRQTCACSCVHGRAGACVCVRIWECM